MSTVNRRARQYATIYATITALSLPVLPACATDAPQVTDAAQGINSSSTTTVTPTGALARDDKKNKSPSS